MSSTFSSKDNTDFWGKADTSSSAAMPWQDSNACSRAFSARNHFSSSDSVSFIRSCNYSTTSHVPDLRGPTLRNLPSDFNFSIIRNMEALVLLNIFDSCLMLIRLSFLICVRIKSWIFKGNSSSFRIVPHRSAIVPHRSASFRWWHYWWHYWWPYWCHFLCCPRFSPQPWKWYSHREETPQENCRCHKEALKLYWHNYRNYWHNRNSTLFQQCSDCGNLPLFVLQVVPLCHTVPPWDSGTPTVNQKSV